MAKILDGKIYSARILAEVTERVALLGNIHGLKPGLAVVLVGEDPASQVYVRNKGLKTLEAGMHSVTYRLPASTSEADLISLVHELNGDTSIHGILVQFPVPDHINQARVIAAIDPAKDVDGLHVVNAGLLASGLPGLVPCTPVGSMIMLRDACPDLAGMNAIVLGRSGLVGKPIAQLLLQADCTVTIAHSRTRDLPSLCRQADILVAAVGRPEMVRGDWIKPGAIVVDVGINRVPSKDPQKAAEGKTRLVGDVAFDEGVEVAGAITPVPGGVGLMTVACLLQNTLLAAERITGIRG